MAATITPETAEGDRGNGDMAEPLDLVGGLFAA